MKILHVIDSADPSAGGPVEAIRNLVGAHEADGHAVSVVTLDPPAAPWLKNLPGAWLGLGGSAGGYAFSLAFVKWLRRHKETFDVVIINGLWKFPGLAVWWELSRMTATPRGRTRRRTPILVYPHGMLDPWFKASYPAKHFKKSCYWALFEQRVLRDAAAVCFTCEEERRLARETFRPYRCREQVVGMGIVSPPAFPDEQARAFQKEFPALAAAPYLLFLSRIHEKKGVDLLLRAYAAVVAPSGRQIPPLVIAGPPASAAYLHSLQTLARRLGLEVGEGRTPPPPSAARQVHFLPMLRGDLKWGAFRGAEAFVLPSHQENFGIAVAEALACGKPALISNRVNIWREIEQGGAGLVAADTEAGTLDALSRWLALSPRGQARMARAAEACFAAKFQVRASADSLMQVIREAVSRKNSVVP